jgi:hypothetical protein
VSVGDARRRDNGLEAEAYAAAGDVDPRVGEHLLDVLALEGIAAYLRPSSDQHPVTWSTTLPKRPTDRLYVDREHLSTARDHLARLAREEREAGEPEGATPGRTEPTSDEVDRAFAQIVAGFGRTPTIEPEGRRTRTRPAEEQPPDPEPSLLDGLDTFGADLPDDESERFVPPEPPPVPKPSMQTALAVVGVVGGLVVFLKPGLISFLNESLAMFLGFAAVVTGAGALIWRLRPGGDDDETDPDHGARV